MERGHPNGCPPFLVGYHEGMKVELWQRVFSAAFHDFNRRVHSFAHWQATVAESGEMGANDFVHHLHAHGQRPLPLDPYAAKNPAEFFAVASEVFFVAPAQLIADYPDVYRLLSRYYRQETIAFPAKLQD
jgi:Mlc titration factor MtfA (ptsG expression regulator)